MRNEGDAIFGVYMKSLLEEKAQAEKNPEPIVEKKGTPPWLKDKKDEKGSDDKKDKKSKGDKEESDDSDDSDDKKSKGKKGKKGKMPAGLAAYMAKKKGGKKPMKESVVTEDHEEFSEPTQEMTVNELLTELETADPELYQRVEGYLKSAGGEGSSEDLAAVGAEAPTGTEGYFGN